MVDFNFKRPIIRRQIYLYAGVAELVDAQDLGSCAARRGGSSPSTRTKLIGKNHNDQ